MASITGQSVTEHVVTASANLSPLEILHAAPNVLLGVSPQALSALNTLEILTVFDLASSRIFANAAMLLEAGTDPRSVLARYGVPPADFIGLFPAGVSIDQLRFQAIDILEGIGIANGPGVAAALHVATVRDLALWPAYLAAQQILRAVFSPDALPGADPEAPADLLPRSGDFPTERVFYSTLVFDDFDGDDGQLIPLEQTGLIDLLPVAGPDFGFKQLGVGALLTFAQSWFAQGVTLGQLLHSVALAPGESTRIAMIDWSRRTSGRQDEDVKETEQLTNVTEHSRALSEVTTAVAQEAQSGFSQTHLASSSSQDGGGIGFSAGPITLGESSGGASSNSDAMSFSSSSGRRDLAAAMSQNVVDRTQQNANSARNRRATVVKEVSQSEHESVSTRVLTNYNHMHALSIQYYEVVQIYRVAVALQRVERCLFLPMRLVNFRNPVLVRMFGKALAAAAVDDAARALLKTDFDSVDVTTLGPGTLNLRNATLVPTTTKANGTVVELPNDAKLGSFYLMPGDAAIGVALMRRDGSAADLDRTGAQDIKVRDTVPIHEIDAVLMTNPHPNEVNFLTSVGCMYKGVAFGLDVQIKLGVGAAPQKVLRFTGGGIRERLIEHLEANRLHYSQAVFRSLDPATITLLLSGFSYRGRPITAQVDPQPLTTAGNYLVFKTHVRPDPDGDNEEERAWAQWLLDHGVSLGGVKEDLVPLPSGGVFAEGVLGRYNSAEKLDMTRFWNWQDSPIPIQAPEIAAIQTGSRGEGEDLKAGPFSQPLVNIVNPTALPAPAGLGPAFQALANGNMFRDMSGLAATIGLAQAGMQATSEAATDASIQAGANLATAAKKEVEMFKAALAFAGAVMGAGSTDTSPSTISNDGAKINHGRSLDQRAAQPAQGGAVAVDGGGGGGGDPGGGAGGGGVADGGSGGSGAGAAESQAFQRALWGQSGESQSDTVRNLLQTTAGGGTGAPVGVGASIPAGGLHININTSADEFDLGWIRMTKHHLFVEANIHIEPTTADADQPSGYGLTPLTGSGGASDRPPQPGQGGKFPTGKMRWFNLGPATYRWRFWRGVSPSGPGGAALPVRSSLVGTLTITESDTWPSV